MFRILERDLESLKDLDQPEGHQARFPQGGGPEPWIRYRERGDMRRRKYFFRWRKQQVKDLEKERAGWHQAGGKMRLVGAGVVVLVSRMAF